MASSISSTAPQTAGVSSSTASPTVTQAPTSDSVGETDFVAVMTQLLGTSATEVAADQADDPTEIEVDGSAALTGDDIAAQMMVSPVPLVAEIPQVVTNAANTSPSRTESKLAATVAAAIAASAQRSAVAGDAKATTGGEAQGFSAQSAQLQSALANGPAAATFSNANDSHDNQANKQDGAGAMPGSAMTIGVHSQTDATRADLQIGSRVGSHAWRDEVAGKLTWMIERGIQHGTLRLSPENLGPMEVRITTQNDQVSVWFGAAHADTRAALENALPRLREMFAAQGMSLADAGVFREPPKDSPRGYTTNGGPAIEGMEERSFAISVRDGLLDAYA